jgi:CHAD domain-containing protein
MVDRLSIEELSRRYWNEDVHTGHVTRLALALFDAVRVWFGLTAQDRTLLEAAGRLHDLGYAAAPKSHRMKSVNVVLQEGLRGYGERQRAYIVAIMSLHQNNATFEKSPLIRNLPNPDRALRLGAILRVADGLDQSHIQDSEVTGVRRIGRSIVVTVRTGLSPDNLQRAQAKSSLWRQVFPMSIRFEADLRPGARRTHVLAPDLSALEGARRLLYLQFKLMRKNEEGCRQGLTEEPLHDLRVALRRYRSLLRIYRKTLGGLLAADIDRRLATVAVQLGPSRDYDVWMRRLREIETAQPALQRSRVWRQYTAGQEQLRDAHLARVRHVLDGPFYRVLMQEMAFFLRIEIPHMIRSKPDERLESFAARYVARHARKIFKAAVPGGSWEVEAFHDLRKQCRRARYAAEYFGPVLGPRTRRWGRRMKELADLLGDLHDADVALEKIQKDKTPCPRALKSVLTEQRRTALAALDGVWLAAKDPATHKRLLRELKKTKTAPGCRCYPMA